MYRRNELILELEHLDYDFETKNMELQGLYKDYHNMKVKVLYYIVAYFIILLFAIFLVVNMRGGEVGTAFSTVLSPIYALLVLVCSIVVIKKIWILYCNGGSEWARKSAKKFREHSISEEIEKCMLSITKIERKMEEINEELLKFEDR